MGWVYRRAQPLPRGGHQAPLVGLLLGQIFVCHRMLLLCEGSTRFDTFVLAIVASECVDPRGDKRSQKRTLWSIQLDRISYVLVRYNYNYAEGKNHGTYNCRHTPRRNSPRLSKCRWILGFGSVSPRSCPLTDLQGFDSDFIPEIVRRLARALGHPLPEGTRVKNIYVSQDRQRKLTIEEVAKRFVAMYAPAESNV